MEKEETPVRGGSNDRGHANNVAHFEELLTRIPLYGTVYNPKNPALQLAAATLTAQKGREVLQDTNVAAASSKMAIDQRKDVFEGLSAKVSGSLGALKVSGVSETVYETAAALARKITGANRSSPEPETLAPGETPAPTRSTSQMSFDNRAANFDAYVTVLVGIPEYDPNEAWLKTAALREFSAELYAANQAVAIAEAALDSKRAGRDRVLYVQDGSLVKTGQMIKDYVKSVFGASSPEYRQLTKLTFVDYDRD